MKFNKKSSLLIIVLTGISILLIMAFLKGRTETALEQERERPVMAPSHVSV